MKARALKALLNNTDYIVGQYEDYIGIGTGYVHNLIQVSNGTFEMKYALGRHGRQDINHAELEFIWDTVEALVKSGEFKTIAEGEDEILCPLIVYRERHGEIIEGKTEQYGWPNTTSTGEVLYNNIWFQTKAQAVEEAINAKFSGIESWGAIIEERAASLQKAKGMVNEYYKQLKMLKKLEKTLNI